MCICENVGKNVHAKLHCFCICPFSELCLMCTTLRTLTLLPSSGEINTIVLKLPVLGPVDQADVGCLTTEAVPFSQHRAFQVGPIPQALDNI